MFFPLMWDFSYFYDTTDLFSVVKSQTLVALGECFLQYCSETETENLTFSPIMLR